MSYRYFVAMVVPTILSVEVEAETTNDAIDAALGGEWLRVFEQTLCTDERDAVEVVECYHIAQEDEG